MINVIQYRNCFLPLSETFIYTYIKHLRRVTPIVVTRKLINEDIFPHDQVLVTASHSRMMDSFIVPVCRRIGIDYFAQKKIRSLLKRKHIALVHAHFGPDGYDAMKSRALNRLPLACSFYGYDASAFARYKTWKNRYQELFSHGNAFMVEGTHMRQRLIDLGCPNDKIHLLRIGVDVATIPFRVRKRSVEPIKILFCGRFVEKKGLMLALRAIHKLNPKKGYLEFRIIGDGDLRPQVVNFMREHFLDDQVSLLGYLPHDKVKKEIQSCDILFQPSLTAKDGDSEGGAPTILIEAQAAGIPIVSTNHADIPEIVLDGKTGLLAQEGDVDDITDKLASMLSHPDEWEEYGKQGRAHVNKQHDISQITYALEELYFNIVGSSGK